MEPPAVSWQLAAGRSETVPGDLFKDDRHTATPVTPPLRCSPALSARCPARGIEAGGSPF